MNCSSHEHASEVQGQMLRVSVQIFVEYVMLHKINDSPETAHELGQLLRGRNMIVNLIPWNPVYSPGMQLEAPGSERVADFQRIVREQYGIFCTVRQEMGQDISGKEAFAIPLICVAHAPAHLSLVLAQVVLQAATGLYAASTLCYWHSKGPLASATYAVWCSMSGSHSC